MKHWLLPATALALALAADRASAQTIDKVVKKVEARFEPATAKPGAVVTLKVEVKLEDGWHTYPTTQLDKGAKNQTNRFTFPKDGSVIFVGELDEPADPKSKSELLLGIEKLLYYPGGGTWERKAVVSPKAAAGDQTVKVKLKLLVCDKDTCLPPETYDLEVKVTVAGDAVPVDPKYKDEVEKVLSGGK